MNTFIEETVTQILLKDQDISNAVFVLPSKRAGTFIKAALKNQLKKTLFAPKVHSIESFVEYVAGVKISTNVNLLFELYEVYKKNNSGKQPDDFQSFLGWGQLILQDFNEIDRYLIDSQSIFSYLDSVKTLALWGLNGEKTELQKNYLSFFKSLKPLYDAYSVHLNNNNIAYQGKAYRLASENIGLYAKNNPFKHYFIGFNALNKAEEKIFTSMLAYGMTEIFWDVDSTFLKDKDHDAGHFIRQYLANWHYYQDSKILPSNHFSSNKNIEVYGVPKNVGQANFICGLLAKMQPKQLEGAAIVLGNENLLEPLLNSLPAEIGPVNVTCGLPLENTPVASFFSAWMHLQESKTSSGWYHQNIISFLSHPMAQELLTVNAKNQANAIISQIRKENLVYVNENYFSTAEFLGIPLNLKQTLFTSTNNFSAGETIKKLKHLVLALKEKTTTTTGRNILQLEYLYRFYRLFNELETLLKKYPESITDIKSLENIYRQLLVKETVDFKGEPLQGLQIMGMLESRNLDFETVIITSVNEGILPSGKSVNSFLPFDVKIDFGLPTYKEKDAVYTYHFYRLLQRAKNVYLLYDTEPDVLEGGEKSRFLLQLSMIKQPNHTIKELIASPLTEIKSKPLQHIKKDALLIQTLLDCAERGFSPSSLANYIRNPIDFYLQTVLKINPSEEIEENIAVNTMGTIVHKVLEELYTPLIGVVLSETNLKNRFGLHEVLVEKYFNEEFKNGSYKKGKNLISFSVVKRYIQNFMNFELDRIKTGAQIKVLALESTYKTLLPIKEFTSPVYLKGTVDRIEEVNGAVHILDYKTGRVTQNELKINDWEGLIEDYKFSKAFQVLCYAYMYQKSVGSPISNIHAGIISFKNLNSGVLQCIDKNSAEKNGVINGDTLSAFETMLKQLIMEILSSDVPFIEKPV